MKLCPKCNLNWIDEHEQSCSICGQTRRSRPVREYSKTGGIIGSSFYEFLVNRGYKEFTEDGKPSTVHSYMIAIEKVCLWEKLTWLELAKNIGSIVKDYGFGGKREAYGNKSHRTVYNALVSYFWFVKKEKII